MLQKIMSAFSERLRELRGPESQASFAASIGVNRVQYAKYESGQNSPSVELLKRICEEHAGVSADWLLGLRASASLREKKTAAQSAAQSAAPGSLPACAKCPFKVAIEAAARKTKGIR